MRCFVSSSYWSWLAPRRDSAIAIEARFASGSSFDPEFVALVDQRGVDVIHVNHCVNMGVARRIAARSTRRFATAPAILLDTQDIQAERYRSCEIANPFTGRCDSPASLTRDELALSRGATALLHLKKHDLEHLRRLLPAEPHFLMRPTTRNEPRGIDRRLERTAVDSMSETAIGRTSGASNGSSTRLPPAWA